MRKAILVFSAIALVCWSIAVAWAWMRIRTEMEPFIGQPSALFVVIAILLYLSAIALFFICLFQQQRVRKRQGMQLTGRNIFRRIAGARPYQREIWLEGAVLLSVPLCALISHSIQLIVGYNVISPFDFKKYEVIQNTISLTLELGWPLATLLYALLSKDLQALVKEEKERNTYDTI